MLRSSRAAVFNDFDLNRYEVSECLSLPSKMDNVTESILLADMESHPDKYVYVDFLGSTYLMEIPDSEKDSPILVSVEGAHFMNLLPKKFWYFAEEYFWDKFNWAVSSNED